MATRLPAAIVALGFLSLIVATVVGLQTGQDLGRELNEERLIALRAAGGSDVASHISNLQRTTEALASSPEAATAIEELTAAHGELLSIDTDELERELVALADDYRETYIDPLSDAGRDIDLRDIAPENTAAIYLQSEYSIDLPVAEADAISDARDGSTWTDIHRAIHPVYRDVVDRLGVDDLFLVEPESAYVVYSERKRPELGTSLATGPFSGTTLARTVRAAAESESVVTSDLDLYDPALTTPVGVVASPVRQDGQIVGVLAVTYDSETLTDILTAEEDWDEARFPETGDTFVVGSDGLTRTDPRTYLENPIEHLDAATESGSLDTADRETIEAAGTTVLTERVAEQTDAALNDGNNDVENRPTMTGFDALSTVEPIPVDGLDWFVVSEVELAASEAAFDDFTKLLVVGTATFMVLLAFWAVAWAARVVSPIRLISDQLMGAGRERTAIEVPTRSPVEFHQLAASFEAMSEALHEQNAEQAAARRERLDLLRKMLPPAVADRIAAGDFRALEVVPQASTVVIVVLGLGALVRVDATGSRRDLVDRLHSELDQLATRHGLDRIKVVGDAYTAACGHDRPYIDHAPRVIAFASDAQNAVREIGREAQIDLDITAGIHTGPVTVGMTGSSRLLYDVWGETVTRSHHLARQAPDGEIVISAETKQLLPETIEARQLNEASAAEPERWAIDGSSSGGPT